MNVLLGICDWCDKPIMAPGPVDEHCAPPGKPPPCSYVNCVWLPRRGPISRGEIAKKKNP